MAKEFMVFKEYKTRVLDAAMRGNMVMVCLMLGACGEPPSTSNSTTSDYRYPSYSNYQYSTTTELNQSSLKAQICAPTNPYRADASGVTTLGSLTTEKDWIKSYLDEAYLWRTEIPEVNASLAAYSNATDAYASLNSYFVALKTPITTISGKPKDKFSFTYSTKAWKDLSVGGVTSGYGINWFRLSNTPPRGIRVASVEAGSPAAIAGVTRGDTLVSVNKVPVDDISPSGINVLNAAIFPKANGSKFDFAFTPVSGVTRSVSLTSATITTVPVPVTKVVTASNGRKVGYLQFNDHILSAEIALFNAVNTLKKEGIQELVLDLRYNGGGYLFLASELAYMVAGSARTNYQTFEGLLYNSKRASTSDTRTPFYNQTCFLDKNFNCTRPAELLPTLNLSRVYVLTSANTCSASESIINGLRGINVEVVLVGGTTCGKPYGFTAKDNCGISYFPIEFQGVNAKGFGDYADGFKATCLASDDLSKPMCDTSEKQFAAALYYLVNGKCETTAASGLATPQAEQVEGELIRDPARKNRILWSR